MAGVQRAGDATRDTLMVAHRLRAVAARDGRSQTSQSACQHSSRPSTPVNTCGATTSRPFSDEGGIVYAYELFGDELNQVVYELNEVLAP